MPGITLRTGQVVALLAPYCPFVTERQVRYWMDTGALASNQVKTPKRGGWFAVEPQALEQFVVSFIDLDHDKKRELLMKIRGFSNRPN